MTDRIAAPAIRCLKRASDCDHDEEQVRVFKPAREVTIHPLHPNNVEAIWYQYQAFGDHKPFSSGANYQASLLASDILRLCKIDPEAPIEDQIGQYSEWYERKTELWKEIHGDEPDV